MKNKLTITSPTLQKQQNNYNTRQSVKTNGLITSQPQTPPITSLVTTAPQSQKRIDTNVISSSSQTTSTDDSTDPLESDFSEGEVDEDDLSSSRVNGVVVNDIDDTDDDEVDDKDFDLDDFQIIKTIGKSKRCSFLYSFIYRGNYQFDSISQSQTLFDKRLINNLQTNKNKLPLCLFDCRESFFLLFNNFY